MASTTPFLAAVASRHSRYNLLKASSVPNSRVIEIVDHALAHGPSPFNVRSARCILLFGDHHTDMWQHAYDVTERDIPGAMPILGPKIRGYQAAHGTVLFFDDSNAASTLSPRFQTLYKQFPEWEEHAAGMHQYIVWTALTVEGLGCNLQHYQAAIQPYMRGNYSIPKSWTCKAQLVFGSLSDGSYEKKEKSGLEGAMKVYE